MSKLICKLAFLVLFASGFASAIPLEDYDAFGANDKLAIRDLESGLVWLDFGVNNGESINSVVSGLDNTYSDWRLPTETEVKGLWSKFDPSNLSGIFDLWGANKTPADNLPYLSWGYFLDDDGFWGAAYIIESDASPLGYSMDTESYSNKFISSGIEQRVIDRRYDASDYYPFSSSGTAEISVLLVRKESVNEPSLLLLSLFIFFVFLRNFFRSLYRSLPENI